MTDASSANKGQTAWDALDDWQLIHNEIGTDSFTMCEHSVCWSMFHEIHFLVSWQV